MTIADRARSSEAERYWRQVSSAPLRAHAYVSLLGLQTFETAELHSRLQQGLSYDAFERLRGVLGLSAARAGELLQIPPRTLARRKDSKRFEPEESDRLVRLSRIVGLGLELFEGDVDEMRTWFTAPHAALGGETPLDFATTDVGAREVENLIGRLEHGIPL
jgi:putative toxin-antitoxin system antitoxin component (TIGR02293 family)